MAAHVWGGEAPEFASTAEAEAVLGAIMARYNEISSQLDRGPNRFQPVFWTSPNGDVVLAADWAEGFFDAIKLRPDAWTPLIEDKSAGLMLTPILALCSDGTGATLLPLDEEDVAQWQSDAPEMIAMIMPAIRKFWRERVTESAFSDPPRRGSKVGRNEPCPCGSGRKYKRCCAAN